MNAQCRSHRATRLTICLSSAFALAGLSPFGFAGGSLTVTSCLDDGGGGTLRSVVTAAVSGDTVDMSALVCSDITLSAGLGAITVPHGITIHGPGFDKLAIHGNQSQVFVSPTAEALTISNLTVADGTSYSATGYPLGGGCIYAAGDVNVNLSVVTRCSVSAPATRAYGGGVFTQGTANLLATSITQCTVTGAIGAGGGGVHANSLMTAYSTLSGNSALTTIPADKDFGRGGGAYVGAGPIVLNSSTVDSNYASDGAGVGHFMSVGTAAATTIFNSTISGNVSNYVSGGMDQYCFSACATPDIKIYNSTVAFNFDLVRVGGISANTNIFAHSSLFADNRAGSANGDLFFFDAANQTLSGANNLVIAVNETPAAGVVTVTSDPRLTPLAQHNASTNPLFARTHGLSLSSPAIGVGDNLLNLAVDERGDQNGGFPRMTGGLTDMGAFERQPNDDEIYYGGFN